MSIDNFFWWNFRFFKNSKKYWFIFEIESRYEESIKNWSENIVNGPWLWILDTVRKKHLWSLFDENFDFSKNQKNPNLFSESSPDLIENTKNGPENIINSPSLWILPTGHKNTYSTVPRAVTWLTVYRALQVKSSEFKASRVKSSQVKSYQGRLSWVKLS